MHNVIANFTCKLFYFLQNKNVENGIIYKKIYLWAFLE